MLNYSFFSVIDTNDPTELNEGIDFGKVSSNEIDHIGDYETFGFGYVILDEYDSNLDYYDFNHQLIWSVSAVFCLYCSLQMQGSDQNLMVLVPATNSFKNISDPEEPFYSEDPYYFNYLSNVTIYDLAGTIVSTFPVDITRMSNDTAQYYQSRKSSIVYSLLSENELYLIEFARGELLNNTYEVNFILHSYELITGQLKWKENLTRNTYPIIEDFQSVPRLNFYEYKFTDSSEQVLTIGTIFHDFKLKQFSIKLDNSNNLDEITEVENNFACLDYCLDDIVLSFNEVIGVSESIDGDKITTTLKSSNGPKLEIINPYWSIADSINSYSGINFYHHTSLTSDENMVNGFISLEPEKVTYFMGFLTSGSELSLTLFGMNLTSVGKMIKIDDNTILTNEQDPVTRQFFMVIWSINKLRAVEFMNPYYIHILPGLALVLLIANISYDRYKKGKYPKPDIT